MKMLREHDYPVPVPVDQNRHCILMQLVDGTSLFQVRQMSDELIEQTYDELMELLKRLGRSGLIHGDYNEYNLMMSSKGKITLIDFPQMMSMDHPNARAYFERDVQCIVRLYRKRFDYVRDDDDSSLPSFDKILLSMDENGLYDEAKKQLRREDLDGDALEKALEAMRMEEDQELSEGGEEDDESDEVASDAADDGEEDDDDDDDEGGQNRDGASSRSPGKSEKSRRGKN